MNGDNKSDSEVRLMLGINGGARDATRLQPQVCFFSLFVIASIL
jgi:hypothetical protein